MGTGSLQKVQEFFLSFAGITLFRFNGYDLSQLGTPGTSAKVDG
jgi:hypothetical protein